MAAQSAVEYLKISEDSQALKWAATGLKDYVGNISQSVAAVFEKYTFLDPPEIRHRIDFADSYLGGFDSKNAISNMQQIDYKSFNYRLFNKLNTDMRNEMYNLMRNNRFENFVMISDMYLDNVRRLAEVLRKSDMVLEELNFRVTNGIKVVNDTIDTYFNSSLQWVEETREALKTFGDWENELFKKFRKALRSQLPRNTAQYFTNVRKYVESFMNSVENDLNLVINYKHREMENFKNQANLFNPILQTADIWIKISTDADESSPCTENYMDKLLLYPNVTLRHFNKCLQKEIENENIASELVTDLIETQLPNIISTAYESFDICLQYSPRKLKLCLDMVSNLTNIFLVFRYFCYRYFAN